MLKKRRRGVTLITPTVERLPVSNNNEITDVAEAHFRSPSFYQRLRDSKIHIIKKKVSKICFEVSKKRWFMQRLFKVR